MLDEKDVNPWQNMVFARYYEIKEIYREDEADMQDSLLLPIEKSYIAFCLFCNYHLIFICFLVAVDFVLC